MATTGPDTSSIALIVASFGSIPCSMWCITASTTTIASSTTMPMASTRPSSDSTLIEKPSIGKKMNAPMSDTGTVMSGISVARQFCRNTKTTTMTSPTASNSVWTISLMPSVTGSVVSSDTTYSMSRGKRCLSCFHRRLDAVGDVERVGARNLEDRDDRRGRPVVAADGVVEHRAQFEPGHVPQPHFTLRRRSHEDVAELLLVEQAALGAHGVGVLRCPCAAGGPPICPAGDQLVLRRDGVGDLRNRQPEPPDDVGPEPHAHRVVAAAEQVDLADPLDAGDGVVDVDRRVVRQEAAVVSAVRRLDRDDQERERQRLLHRDAVVLHRLRHLGLGL